MARVLRLGEEDGSSTVRAFVSSYPMILESSQHRHHQQLEPLGLSLWNGSSEIVLPSSENSSCSSKTSGIIGQLSHFEHGREGAHGSLGKMITSVAKGSGKGKTNARDPNKHSSGAAIRMCSNCNTTKTPLWRSGPWGPKSLCNACGIRQRKAKHAMEVAAAVAIGSGKNPRSKPCKVLKEMKREESCIHPFKKGGCNSPCAQGEENRGELHPPFQRKAKHAMEVAAVVAIGSGKNRRSKPCKVLKEKKREESCILPFKKRFKITNL